jgi:hypothetical protein
MKSASPAKGPMIETEQNETTVWRCRWFSGGRGLVLNSWLQLGWSGFLFIFWFSFSRLMDRSQESLLYWRVDVAVWPELLSCTGVRGTREFSRTSFASSIWSVMVSSTASQIDWPLLIQIRRSVWLIWSGSTKALVMFDVEFHPMGKHGTQYGATPYSTSTVL